jgi:hypothetical protein
LKCRAEQQTAHEKHILKGTDNSTSKDRNYTNHKNSEFQISVSKRSVRAEPRKSKEHVGTTPDHPGSITALVIKHSDANV